MSVTLIIRITGDVGTLIVRITGDVRDFNRSYHWRCRDLIVRITGDVGTFWKTKQQQIRDKLCSGGR